MQLTMTGIWKVYQDEDKKKVLALQDIHLEIEEGEFLCLIGPSGCGKSTLLNLLAGFFQPTRGEIRLQGKPITSPGPDRGVVFQEYTLFPWLTILQNVEFGLRNLGVDGKKGRERARYYLQQVGLDDFEKAYPFELSGGMKQRVAIARILALDPAILLMDEPFGALDAQIRENLQEQVLTIWKKEGKTIIFVTHHVDEAVFLGERVVVFTPRPGRIKEVVPLHLPRPRDRYGKELSQLKKKVLLALSANPLPAGSREVREVKKSSLWGSNQKAAPIPFGEETS